MSETKDRIKQVMSWANMTQNDFAQKLKVSPASLSSIFSGRTRPTNMHISSIHGAFPQVSINWLMFGEGEMILRNQQPLSEGGDLFSSISDNGYGNNHPDGSSDESLIQLAAGVSEQGQYADPSQQGASGSAEGYRNQTRRQSKDSRGASQEQYGTDKNRLPNTSNSFDIPQRKITEIRVFYDNGTYESFFPPKK